MDVTLEDSKVAKLPRWAYLGIMVVMVLIATIVNSCIGVGEFDILFLISIFMV